MEKDGRFSAATSLAELRQLLPGSHPEIGTLLSDLAVLHERRGDPETAIDLYNEALDIQRHSLGEQHDAIARTLHNLGTAEMALGRWQAAESTLEASRAMLDQIYSSDHPLKATCLYCLSQLRRSTGDWKAAAALLNESLEMRIRLYGEEHELVGQSRFALARVVARDDPQRAEKLYERVIEQLERILPADDYRLSYPIFRWGILRFDQGNPAGAEPLLRRAWELRRQGLPEDSWETAVAGGWLGRCLGQLGRTGEAHDLLETSLGQLEETLGVDDSRTRDLGRFLAELSP